MDGRDSYEREGMVVRKRSLRRENKIYMKIKTKLRLNKKMIERNAGGMKDRGREMNKVRRKNEGRKKR